MADKQEKKSFMDKEIKLWGDVISNQTKFNFYADLHMLLSSGIDILTSIEIVSENFKRKPKRK
jgi:type II secretory pathway component PulF